MHHRRHTVDGVVVLDAVAKRVVLVVDAQEQRAAGGRAIFGPEEMVEIVVAVRPGFGVRSLAARCAVALAVIGEGPDAIGCNFIVWPRDETAVVARACRIVGER